MALEGAVTQLSLYGGIGLPYPTVATPEPEPTPTPTSGAAGSAGSGVRHVQRGWTFPTPHGVPRKRKRPEQTVAGPSLVDAYDEAAELAEVLALLDALDE